jgi:TP901 family phage tail tape measure protein
MARARVGVEFTPVDARKVEAALARIQAQANGRGAESINKLSRPLGKITGQATEFQKSLEASNARVLAFGASVAVINKLSEAFGALVSNTVKVEATFAKINTILGGTKKELEAFGNGIFKVAQKTSTSFDQVAEGALELARQGLSVEDSLSRVETALKLVRVAGIDSQQAVAGLTAAIKGFEGAGLTVAQIADKLAEVDTKFAVSTEDLINGLERASASARVAGVSFDELLSVVTTVQERTQRGGAVIGNAFKTIFARLGRADTLVALQDLGISVLDVEGNVRSAVPLFQELAVELDKLGLKSVQAGNIIQKVAGVRQRDILISLVEDLNSEQSQFAKALQVSAGAAGSLDAKNAKLNDTLEALINNLTVGGQKLASVMGEIGFTEGAKDLLKVFGNVVNSITDILQGESVGSKFAQSLLKGIGNTLVPGVALIGAIFFKLFKDLVVFGTKSLKQILGMNKAAEAQGALQRSVLQTLLQNENIQREILALEGNKIAQEKLLLNIYNQQAAALARVQKAAATVTPGLFGAGLRGGERGVTRKGKAADGYIAAEARDVSRGVGGAPSSAKVVSIPNFAFGGGKRGTMVANTSEYYVPNYAGGGDAIFNQNMVKSMGLPPGAKKINAAGGYVPNFVKPSIKLSQRTDITTREEAEKAGYSPSAISSRFGAKPTSRRTTYDVDLNEVLGAEMPAMFVPSGGGGVGKITRAKIPGFKDARVIGEFMAYGPNYGSMKKLEQEIENKFGQKSIEDFAAKEALGLARNIASAFALDPVDPKKISQVDGVKGFISSAVGAFGGIFDAALTTALKLNSTDEKVGGDFDVDLTKSNITNIQKVFGKRKYPRFIDNKINANQGLSMFEKTKKTPILMKKINDAAFNIGKNKGFIKASSGYIPNFAGGLEGAIMREQAAGLPLNQIRINQNGKLRNAQNPMGLAVTNTRDEPTGAIPNFAKGDSGGFGAGGAMTAIFAAQALAGFAGSLAEGNEKLQKLINVIGTAVTIFSTLSLLGPTVKNFETSLSKTADSLKGATLTFDRSAKRFRTSSGQFAPSSAGKSIANRGRVIGGVAARLGSRALALAGPVGIAASILVPLAMELELFKDKTKEIDREAGENLRSITNKIKGFTDQAQIEARMPIAETILAKTQTKLRPMETEAFEKYKSRVKRKRVSREEFLADPEKYKRFFEDYEEYYALLKKEENTKKTIAELQKKSNDLTDQEKEKQVELARLMTTQKAVILGKGIGQRNIIQAQREGVLGPDGTASIERRLATKTLSSSQRLSLEQEKEKLELAQQFKIEAIEQNKAFAEQLLNKQEIGLVNEEMAQQIYSQIDGTKTIEELNDQISKLVGKSFEEQTNLVAKAKEESKTRKVNNKLSEDLLEYTQETARAQQKLNTGLAGYRTRLADRLQKQSEELPANLAQNLEDSLNNTFDKLATGAYDSIGDAFLQIALDFGRELQRQMTQRAVGNIMDGITGSSAGQGFFGGIKKFLGFNSGGIVTGGSGVRDDVPAVLTGGEYVLKKSAVQKYGVDFLERLNSGGIKGYADGGYIQGSNNTQEGPFSALDKKNLVGGKLFEERLAKAKQMDFFTPGTRGAGSIVGKANLLAFAQQEATSGATDVIRASGSGASINLEDQSSRLTAFGRFRDSPARRALKESQQKAFDLYVARIEEEKRVAEQVEAAKKARSQQFKQAVIGSFVNAATAGVGAYFQNLPSSTPQGLKGFMGETIVEPYKAFGGSYNALSMDQLNSSTLGSFTGSSRNLMTGPLFNRANGGQMSGNTNALLMGGEYVMSAQAASAIGRDTLDSINMMRYENGGAVGNVASSSSSGASSEGADVGEVNITINMAKGDASVTDDSNGNADPTKTKEFARKIKEVVVNVIAEEKRVSGSLFTRRK